jgi:hypothetical protein
MARVRALQQRPVAIRRGTQAPLMPQHHRAGLAHQPRNQVPTPGLSRHLQGGTPAFVPFNLGPRCQHRGPFFLRHKRKTPPRKSVPGAALAGLAVPGGTNGSPHHRNGYHHHRVPASRMRASRHPASSKQVTHSAPDPEPGAFCCAAGLGTCRTAPKCSRYPRCP